MSENKLLNSITPGNEYLITHDAYKFMNNLVKGQMSSICFRRETEKGVTLKPATRSDRKFVLEIFEKFKIPFEETKVAEY
tara:strand:+ start:201 stop:440 length:240 start_codon:yes stop_codon:yes gene_type:complete